MTNEEAIKLIKKHGKSFMADNKTNDALEHAIDVLEKQTPKMSEEIHPRVIIQSMDGEYTTHRGLTLEELKAEAKRQGFVLAKVSTSIPKLPCTCGQKPSVWYDEPYYYVMCSHCNQRGMLGKNTNEAWRNWNIEVSR